MANLRLELLGGIQFDIGGQPHGAPRAKKARALLAYLALQSGRSVPRDRLAALLWSRSNHSQARHSLSQALSAIRACLEGAGTPGLTLTAETVRLDMPDLDVDAVEFEALAARGDPESLGHAVTLFRGALLDGLLIDEPAFQTWRRVEQERLKETAVGVLTALSRLQSSSVRHGDAIALAQRLLSLDPLNEQAHRALIRLFIAQGQTDAALRQYRTLETGLKREVGTQPDAETHKLLQAIRSRSSPAPAGSFGERTIATDAEERPSLIVLPFIDFSDDPDPHCLAQGLSDDLTSDLSRISDLLVISRATSLAYKGRNAAIREIASRLKVRYVVEGSVQRAGNRVRINVRFVDGATETQIWSERFDRDIEEAFLLQNEITGRVAAALRLELLKTEGQRVRLNPPRNVTAWSCAMRGWAELWTGKMSEQNYRRAKRYIDKALELDPEQALARTALSRLYYVDSLYPFGTGDRVASYSRALAAAEKAVSLAPDCAEAHSELASALKSQRRYDEAVLACETALRLNPNYEEAYINFATLEKDLGRPDNSLPLFEQSLRIAPQLPTNGRRAYFIAWAHLMAGQHNEALAQANRSLTLDRSLSGPRWIRACVFGWRGEMAAAKSALTELDQADPFLCTATGFAQQYSHVANNEHALEGLLRAGLREG